MNEHYVTSREWSERLKKVGIPQVSEFYWVSPVPHMGRTEWELLDCKDDHAQENISAYLTDELAGMLPNTLGVGEGLTITKYPKHWTIRYGVPERMLLPYKNIVFKDDSLPNALAAMVEYCKQKGLI